LEVLFRNKEDCEDCEDFMYKVDKIELIENSSKYQASQYEDHYTQVYAHIFVPFIGDYVYSISNMFSKSYVEYIMHEYQEPHANTFSYAMHTSQKPHAETPMHAFEEPRACTIHAYREPKRGSHTSHAIMSLSEYNFHKHIGYLNSS
jgi:hypothetical protein